MPRYELSDGTSNKFWEIELSGNAFTTTYGKIGTKGQSTRKELKTDAEAKKEYDKIIAEKVKKGYKLVAEKTKTDDQEEGGDGGQSGGDARNKELEQAIVADPDNLEAWAVYGDWLQEKGDPRGELIALELAGKDEQAAQLIEKHVDYFLGPLAEHQKCHDPGLGNNMSSNRYNPDKLSDKDWETLHSDAFHWKHGFINWARLSHSSFADESWEGSLAEVLDLLLRHPSGRLLATLSMCFNGDDNEDDLQDLIDILAKKAPKTLRKIIIGDNIDQISWYHVGNLGKLWKGVSGLAHLHIFAGSFLLGTIEAPSLRHATFVSGGMSKVNVKSIAAATWPKIERLEVYFGDENYGGDATIKEVQPLLDRTDLKSLAYLALANSEYALTEALVEALPASSILRTIKHLDLSHGCMTDALATELAKHKAAFSHLDTLDVSENYLTETGIAALELCAKKLIADEQRDDDDPEYRHPAIAE